MNKYEEEKMKWDQAFNRCLSDREFAEGLLDQLDKAKEEIESLQEQLYDAEARYREESNKPKMSERWAETIAKVESIMAIPAEELVDTVLFLLSHSTIDLFAKVWKKK